MIKDWWARSLNQTPAGTVVSSTYLSSYRVQFSSALFSDTFLLGYQSQTQMGNHGKTLHQSASQAESSRFQKLVPSDGLHLSTRPPWSDNWEPKQTCLRLSFYSWQGGRISVPETVEDDSEESIGTPSDDLESAVPIDNKKEVKFGWIRGVLVSCAGIFCALQNSGCSHAWLRPAESDCEAERDFHWLAQRAEKLFKTVYWDMKDALKIYKHASC